MVIIYIQCVYVYIYIIYILIYLYNIYIYTYAFMLAVFTSFQPDPVLPIGLSSLARKKDWLSGESCVVKGRH